MVRNANEGEGVDLRIVQRFKLADLSKFRKGRLGELADLIAQHLAANML